MGLFALSQDLCASQLRYGLRIDCEATRQGDRLQNCDLLPVSLKNISPRLRNPGSHDVDDPTWRDFNDVPAVYRNVVYRISGLEQILQSNSDNLVFFDGSIRNARRLDFRSFGRLHASDQYFAACVVRDS